MWKKIHSQNIVSFKSKWKLIKKKNLTTKWNTLATVNDKQPNTVQALPWRNLHYVDTRLRLLAQQPLQQYVGQAHRHNWLEAAGLHEQPQKPLPEQVSWHRESSERLLGQGPGLCVEGVLGADIGETSILYPPPARVWCAPLDILCSH